jgi:hypothetical protein
MAAPSFHAFDDELLTQYLLGTLTEAETERLDELSVVDDDFAAGLAAAEHDLVDAYVRGGMSGPMRQQFESRYLDSPIGREKVRFARALATVTQSAPVPMRRQRVPLDLRWMLAAAAAVLLAAAGYVVSENVRLRRELTVLRAATDSLEQRAERALAELDTERRAGADAAKQIAELREALADFERRTVREGPQPITATFLLRPATRGAGGDNDIAIPADVAAVRLQVPLDADEFPHYEATIADASTSEQVWHSGRLVARAEATRRIVSLTVPARSLGPRQYVLELSGVPRTGPAESLNTFPFRVVRR